MVDKADRMKIRNVARIGFKDTTDNLECDICGAKIPDGGIVYPFENYDIYKKVNFGHNIGNRLIVLEGGDLIEVEDRKEVLRIHETNHVIQKQYRIYMCAGCFDKNK